MERFPRSLVGWLCCLGLAWVSPALSEDAPGFDSGSLEFFEKEVRPILISRCFECHSNGKGALKGGLALDSRDGLIRGGDTGPGLSLEKPADSLFLSAINYGDLYQMPPKSKLPANEIALLTKWVELGAPWPKETASNASVVKPLNIADRVAEHWCWHPLRDIAPPAVKNAAWPRTSVDRFILASLESHSIQPAEEAGKRVLLRRIFFDLIGLPPSPDEVESFVSDQRPNALEEVVDRLLSSVQFGERWARHWLDLTRFAETRGHEFDPLIPNAWQYRDYVIRALNADVPYDRFLREHIAGDLLEPRYRSSTEPTSNSALPINESILGTGFWFLGEEVHSPVDVRKDETDRMDNRLDVMSKSFLGLTLACARCHDHKFDAISQRDYYALAGFAISGSYRQVRIDTFEQHQRIANQLESLRAESRQAIARSLVNQAKPMLETLERYWLSAKQAVDQSEAEEATAATKERLAQRAAESSLDTSLWTQWFSEFKRAKQDGKHPLHGVFPSSQTDGSLDAASQDATPGLVVDFGDPGFHSPMQDGVSFGLQPIPRGRLIVDVQSAAHPFRVATTGGWERDPFWNPLKLAAGTEVDHGTLGSWQSYGRMVRTPEFTLHSGKIWYLINGSIRAYASVNSHTMIAGPLHGGLLQQYNKSDDGWRWVLHDLGQYRDHRLHVEFLPVDDSRCAIARVFQSEEQPKLPAPDWEWINQAARSEESDESRIAVYANALRRAVMTIGGASRAPNQAAAANDAHAASSSAANATNALTQSDEKLADLADWFVTHRSLFAVTEPESALAALRDAEEKLAKQVQWESRLAPAMLDGNGVDELLLVRGNSNSPKEPVPRRFLEAFQSLGHEVANLPDHSHISGSGRSELAETMLLSPLASRVAVNRIWHHLFGRGIVPTVDNMGVLGLPPSHPELLDHLANQFVKQGWSTKQMIRSLVLSSTYQMSSHPTAAEEADPDNRLWHRMPIKRLEGEVIRDSLLAVSGRLDRTSYGPSVPIHLTEFMQGRGRPGANGPLDGNGRRSIYIAVRRNFLSPMMLAFDTPSPFSTVGRRTISNVPAQALILMNDPFVVEQARSWANRLLSDASMSPVRRLDLLYISAFARHPTTNESNEALAFLERYGGTDIDGQREAWVNLCHVMFNVKEFVFID